MPTTLRVLGQSAPTAAVEAALYTCGTTSAVISTIVVCNTSSTTPDTFSARINVAGAGDTPKQLLFSLAPVPPNTTVTATIGITLANTDVVSVLSTNGTTVFSVFGQENS